MLTCPACKTRFRTRRCWAAKAKVPTCSRRCNGKLRGAEWAKHGSKGKAGWTASSRASYQLKMRGANNPAWKGGATYKHRHGNYVQVKYVRCPPNLLPMARKDGYIMEHRLVMACRVGRCLTRTEVVHHVDHNPLNNDPSNLELWPTNRLHKLAEAGKSVIGAANLR